MKLTLKDLFAMHAMQSILRNGMQEDTEIVPGLVAKQAYDIAFAMWEERERLTLTHRFNDSALEYPVDAVVQKREI